MSNYNIDSNMENENTIEYPVSFIANYDPFNKTKFCNKVYNCDHYEKIKGTIDCYVVIIDTDRFIGCNNCITALLDSSIRQGDKFEEIYSHNTCFREKINLLKKD